MSEASLKIGQKVEVSGKSVCGVVAYVGHTSFASGKWIGVVLDEAKGKNNGSVQGQTYFHCEENCGVFVRPTQLTLLDDAGNPVTPKRPAAASAGTPDEAAKTRRLSSVRRKSPQKPLTLSTSSSRISLASSRQSLAGSRQSLAGSRSHLASPAVEKTPETEHISQIPKRASFVETGFVETLKPQFIPGQSLTSPSVSQIQSVEEKVTNLQLQQELENIRSQNRDLNEKLETLKLKRQDDREKLKEADKMKIQLEQLIEFKSKIMESQISLQRELQKNKQEARDAIEAKEAHAEEMADLAETVEMATLDKEMAEEKAETLQMELDVCKERIEEMTLDLEILKAEMQGKGSESGSEVSAYEFKQLQQHNARLRETLVRFRDVTAQDKHENQKLCKDLEHKKSEIAELGRTKEKLSSTVELLEHQIADLQEQVDAALGAEEMVVLLGEQKMLLEDKVQKLEEEVAELEALQDMNDQLVESNAELEMELREELDMANAATREVYREKEAAFETIVDREITINKFRELVQKLQEQSQELQRRLEQESSKPVSALPEILDFKKMFTETKAHTKAIDLELRQIEVQQSLQHVKYLSAFMPDTFMNRGGDHDAILVLLLIPRLLCKSEILLNQIRDKFPSVDKIDRTEIVKGHSVEQYAFRTRFSHYLYALQTVLHQYVYSLTTCSPETLLKVGATYPEILAQEKIIDGFVELLKKDQLDENLQAESVERCVGYFHTMYPIILGVNGLLNYNTLLNDHVKALNSACDSINTDSLTIRSLVEGANMGDVGLLIQYTTTAAENIQQQLKLIKRRIPLDPNITNLGLNKEVYENLYQCYVHACKVIKTLQDVVKSTTQSVLVSGELEKGLSVEKVKDFAINASDKIYEQDDLGPIQSIKNSLGFILTQVSQVAQFLQDNEYDISVANKNEERPIPPVIIRAGIVKKELEEIKNLTNKLENKEAEIKEIYKQLKSKQEELSQMTIRKELAEKKLGNVNKDYELMIEKLQRKLEETQNSFRKKEKEFEETLDHLQTDIDSLENERGEMREKLKMYSKKVLIEGITKSTSGSQLMSLTSSNNGPCLPAMVRDSPLLLQEIDMLKTALECERSEKLRIQCQDLKKKLVALKPLPNFKKNVDDKLNELLKEGTSLKHDILMTLATPKVVDISNRKPGTPLWLDRTAPKNHLLSELNRLQILQQRNTVLQQKVTTEIINRKFGGKVESDFTVFPTKEMSKVLRETKPVTIGEIQVPLKYMKSAKPATVPVELDYNDLQKLLLKLIA